MSRSGYTEDCDGWALVRWRGAVKSAIRGARGQAMLRETLAALDALPEKRLAAESLVNSDGEYCTLGALGRARGIDMSNIDPECREEVASAFGVSEALAAEIMFMNDEWIREHEHQQIEIVGPIRPAESRFKWVREQVKNAGEKRFNMMRDWVSKQINSTSGESHA